MKLKDKIVNIFLYLGLGKGEYKKIEVQLQLENRKILLFMSVIVFFIQATMTVVNLNSSYLNTSTFFYVIGAITEVVLFVLCSTVAKRNTNIVPYLVEINLIIVYALCVGIATFGSSETEPCVTLFVVEIFMPLVFVGRPITFAITNIVANIAFIALDNFKTNDVYMRDLTNAIVYLVLSIALSTWLIQTRAGNKKLLYDLDETQKSLEESFGIVEGLNREYIVLLVVDKKTLKTSVVRSSDTDKINSALRTNINTFDYTFFFNNYIDINVLEEDKQRLSEEVNPETVLSEIDHSGIYSVNYRRVNDKGESIHHQVSFVNMGADKDSDSFVVGFRDIDSMVKEEQKKQRQLQDALNSAEYANSAKTVFLNNMSHDIRTPMNAIVGFTALAAAHIDNKELVEDYLKKISTSSQHLLSLINDVLDMSRIESGKMKIEEKEVHLPDVLHDLRNIIQVSISSKQLNLFFDTVDVTNEDVICDPLRLNQVLINLTSNAIKFTQAGGFISIRLVQTPSSKSGYANYEFHVKDNGIGMSEEFAAHVFDSFAREENSMVSKIQGTGLGMAITKSIVDMMDGTITVQSEKGVGSEFIVTIPLAVSSNGKVQTAVPELKDIRALVVDDDSDSCINTCEMLRRIGLDADWTLSGHEAVLRAEVAKKQSESYGAFIIDYIMPDMNGIETVRRIRRVIGNDTPIIVLTAYDWSDVEQEAREAGVTAFCSKPLFMSELKEALTKPFAIKSEEVEEEPAKADFSGRRILLVEDNELNREIAVSLLSEYDLVIDEAENGAEAFKMISESEQGYYELVLMDIQMPVMDGYEATRKIRRLYDPVKCSVPIIAMTANAFEEDKRLALEAGMNGHLTKPIDIDSVLAALSKYLK